MAVVVEGLFHKHVLSRAQHLVYTFVYIVRSTGGRVQVACGGCTRVSSETKSHNHHTLGEKQNRRFIDVKGSDSKIMFHYWLETQTSK